MAVNDNVAEAQEKKSDGPHLVVFAPAYQATFKELFTNTRIADGTGHILQVADGVRPEASDGRQTYRDNPNASAASRSLNALIDFYRRGGGAMTPEQKTAFESAMAKADGESAHGGSPILPELRDRLARVEEIKKAVQKLTPEQQSELRVLNMLRELDPGKIDQDIDKLVPGKDAKGETFSQRLTRAVDAGDMDALGQKNLENKIKLEERAQEATRIYYAAALAQQGTPEDDKKAAELIRQALTINPAAADDDIVKRLMKQYKIKRPIDL